jgi:hypothetical protein
LNFDGAEAVPMTKDPDVHLSKVQYLPTEADMTKTKNLPYREGINPPTYTPTGINPDATFETPTVAESLEKPNATYAEAVQRNFRPIKGAGEIRLACGDEENGLPDVGDSGEAPQHREMGYKPIMDEESSLDQSKGTRDAISTMWMAEAEIDEEVAGIHAADARRLFWEIFPPAPGINKPPSEINKPTYRSRPHAYT